MLLYIKISYKFSYNIWYRYQLHMPYSVLCFRWVLFPKKVSCCSHRIMKHRIFQGTHSASFAQDYFLSLPCAWKNFEFPFFQLKMHFHLYAGAEGLYSSAERCPGGLPVFRTWGVLPLLSTPARYVKLSLVSLSYLSLRHPVQVYEKEPPNRTTFFLHLQFWGDFTFSKKKIKIWDKINKDCLFIN